MALSMWCFCHLLGGKGRDGPSPVPAEGRVGGADAARGVHRGQERALREEELLLEFRPKRQYQPQVTRP